MYGFELEVAGIGPETAEKLAKKGFRIADDGSIRGTCYAVEGVSVTNVDPANELPNGRNVRRSFFGAEIVTPPMTEQEILKAAEYLEKNLKHTPMQGNMALHIHIDMRAKHWTTVQNAIAWFYKLEKVLYRLSSGGVTQRGAENDYKYYRPLSKPIYWQPTCTRSVINDTGIPFYTNPFVWYNDFSPMLLIENIIRATSATEMMFWWGRFDAFWGSQRHYVPHRLHGLNIASLTRYRTIELRIFNGVIAALPYFVQLAIDFDRLIQNESAFEFPYTWKIDYEGDIPFSKIKHLLPSSRKLWDATQWQPSVIMPLLHHYNNIRVSEYIQRLFSIEHEDIFDDGDEFYF